MALCVGNRCVCPSARCRSGRRGSGQETATRPARAPITAWSGASRRAAANSGVNANGTARSRHRNSSTARQRRRRSDNAGTYTTCDADTSDDATFLDGARTRSSRLSSTPRRNALNRCRRRIRVDRPHQPDLPRSVSAFAAAKATDQSTPRRVQPAPPWTRLRLLPPAASTEDLGAILADATTIR